MPRLDQVSVMATRRDDQWYAHPYAYDRGTTMSLKVLASDGFDPMTDESL